jgi:hypothetical protein
MPRFWIAEPGTGRRRGGVEYAEGSESTFDLALLRARDDLGSPSWMIYLGDERTPWGELAYYTDGKLYISDLDRVATFADPRWSVGGEGAFGVRPLLSPDLLPQPPAMVRTSVRGLSYPAVIQRYDNFTDESYGNDITDSVAFSIGDKHYALWIEPGRVIDRSPEAQDGEHHRYLLWEIRGPGAGQDTEEALSAREWVDTALSTDDSNELVAFLNEGAIETVGFGAHRQTALGKRNAELAEGLAELFPYNGWRVEFKPWTAEFVFEHDSNQDRVELTRVHATILEGTPRRVDVMVLGPDPEKPWHITTLADKAVPFALETPGGLFSIVKRFLDEFQPARGEEDDSAERFRQIELGEQYGPRRPGPEAPDDSAERFKLLELNPCSCHRHNPEMGATCEKLDYDVILCEEDDPALAKHNPPRPWGNEPELKKARKTVAEGVEKLDGFQAGYRVHRIISTLPVLHNPRLSTAIARTLGTYVRATGQATPHKLEISSVKIPADKLQQILVHEYSHAARMILSPNLRREGAHGQPWKMLMITCGMAPDVYEADPRILGQTKKGKAALERKATFEQAMAEQQRKRDQLAREFGGSLPLPPPLLGPTTIEQRRKEWEAVGRPPPLPPLPPPTPPPVQVRPIRVGDRVAFLSDDGGFHIGDVIKASKKQLVVDDGDDEWGVAPDSVRRVGEKD